MSKSRKHHTGQYAPLPYAFLKSVAWRSLSGSAARLFLELHTRFNGSNNGKICLSYAEAAQLLGLGKATIKRAYEELIEKGFVRLEQKGNWYHRRAHEWRITTKPVQGVRGRIPPTNEWYDYKIDKTKRVSETEPSCSKVVPFQNRADISGAASEPLRSNYRCRSGSNSEH